MAEALGSFEQAVLVCVAQLRGDAYGRAVLHEVTRRLDRKVPSGAVYITLERLEAQGLISSHWVTPKPPGRARRYYVVEAAGMRALSRAKAVIDSLWEGFICPRRHGGE
jgi:PadR family transcriptional regulator PadR